VRICNSCTWSGCRVPMVFCFWESACADFRKVCKNHAFALETSSEEMHLPLESSEGMQLPLDAPSVCPTKEMSENSDQRYLENSGTLDITFRFGIMWVGNTYGAHVRLPLRLDGSAPVIISCLDGDLHAEVGQCGRCKGHTEAKFCLKLSFNAHREGPLQESIDLSWSDGRQLTVRIRGSVLGLCSRKPSLRPGVYLVHSV